MKCCTSCNNCEPDTDEFIITDVLKDIDVNIPEKIVDSSEDAQYEIFDSESSLSSPTRPILQVKPTLQTCSEVYFTGYLAKKCLSKFTCLECQLNLINSNKNLDNQQDLLIMYKTYGHVGPMQGLKAPSDNLLSISKICFEIFLNNYSHLKVGKNILNQLKEKSLRKINNRFPDLQNSPCYFHYLYIIELLFRTKIYKMCKWENSEIYLKKYSQNVAKLRVFQNK